MASAMLTSSDVAKRAWEASGSAFGGDLPIVDPYDPSLLQKVKSQGYIGILPLWSGLYTIAGLKLVPGLPPKEWPGVLISGNGYALTIATSSSSLLCKWFLHEVSLYKGIMDRVEGNLDEVSEGGRQLHLAIDGQDTVWTQFVAGFGQALGGTIRAKPGTDQFEGSYSALARQVDRSREFEIFADWMDRALTGSVGSPAFEDVGCWASLAAVLASLLNVEGNDRWLARVLERNCGIDTSVSLPLSWGIQPGPTSAEATLAQSARRLSSAGSYGDAFTQAVVDAVLSSGVEYDGLVHAESVPLLAEAGEGLRAWEVLCSAAWWMNRNLKEIPPAIFDGARLLCEQNGWDDIRWVSEQYAGASS